MRMTVAFRDVEGRGGGKEVEKEKDRGIWSDPCRLVGRRGSLADAVSKRCFDGPLLWSVCVMHRGLTSRQEWMRAGSSG